ncbi:hypothetical protein BD289DRAFT_482828 [Coniella lustricola]|uniref:Uncharacterized protein n=1 Tax=Coniella lustricola TaxID=2025994 RepID=A0A2T3A7R2_9PEZI|nr:hypothetical protein BD289DRAFT_482828 [Coniella lustricola]
MGAQFLPLTCDKVVHIPFSDTDLEQVISGVKKYLDDRRKPRDSTGTINGTAYVVQEKDLTDLSSIYIGPVADSLANGAYLNADYLPRRPSSAVRIKAILDRERPQPRQNTDVFSALTGAQPIQIVDYAEPGNASRMDGNMVAYNMSYSNR